jgi:prepilin-type N-terminal cleavage/methylation domain-containing protein
MRKHPVPRGFTLLELAVVLAIMGLLAALAVPGYSTLVRRSRNVEARALTETIAHAELRHQRDTGKLLACAKTPAEVPPSQGALFGSAPCWRTLGIDVRGTVYFQYEVELVEDSFRVVARGDLDGDGEVNVITLDGASLLRSVEASE